MTCHVTLTKWSIDKDSFIELSGCGRDVNLFHLLKAAERVTLISELSDLALVEGTRDEKDDVVDHVAIPEKQWTPLTLV